MNLDNKRNIKIQIFIMAHNRVKYLKDSLDSVLSQNIEKCAVILSDNSTNNEVENLIKLNYINTKNFVYKKRYPSLSSSEHYHQVIHEVSSDYFMIFHDDDIMGKNCIKKLFNHLEANPDLVACGANGIMFYDLNTKFKKRFIKSKKEILINNPEDIAKRYLLFGEVAPFPSYLYRKNIIKNLTPGNDEGKYSDVSFIIKISKLGKILWDPNTYIFYRKHFEQDSFITQIHHSKKLVNFICQNTKFSKYSSEVSFFRFKMLSNKMKNIKIISKKSTNIKRNVKILFRIFIFSPFNIFLRLIIWKIYFKLRLFKKYFFN